VVSFSRLANARLTYTTFLSSARDVLSQADLVKLLAPAPAAGAAPATGAAPAAGQAPQPAPNAVTISDARKRELLLLYLNRLIDVVFPQ
jgi:hypothetical protein